MPTIDIDENDARIQYTATAGQTDFVYDFTIFNNTDITVVQEGVTLTLTTDYTVSGAGDEGGGTITLTSGATVGDTITIFRDSTISRESQYQVDGRFDAGPLERDLDRVFTILQEQSRDIGRAVSLDIDSTLSTISLPAASASKIIAWNAGATALENGPSVVEFTTVTNTATTAAATATTQAGIATTAASTATTQAGIATTQAGIATAAAASVNLPSLGTAGQMLKVNSGATALEYVAPAAILADAAADIDVNAQKIVDLADPTSAQDAATKSYVDAAGGGWENGGYVAGRYYGNRLNGSVSASGVAVTANRHYAIPFFVGASGLNRIGVNVITSASGNGRLGIYTAENGVPTNLFEDVGVIDTSTTGVKEVAISIEVPSGFYFLTAVFDATPSIAYLGNTNTAEQFAVLGAASVSGVLASGIYNSHTYGALPDPFGGSITFNLSSTDFPYIFLRKV